MTSTGIVQIDELRRGGAAVPLTAANAAPDTVGFIQDALIGHGHRGLPGVNGAGRGTYGPRTTEAVREFQRAQQLPESGSVDAATLRGLLQPGWTKPLACCAYVAPVLDIPFEGMVRLVSLTSQFEGAGLFAAINRNTDSAGLSFGLIQWAQKPKRLNELLRAFQSREPAVFVDVVAGGDAVLARDLVAHTAKPRGGTDDRGATTNPLFDLVSEPWLSRFAAAGRRVELQRVQLALAVEAFTTSLTRLQQFASQIRSERGIAFMLDVANQHGNGGAESIVRKVNAPGLDEAALLSRVQEESVARVRAQFGEGAETQSTFNRRQAFRTTALLSDAAGTLLI